MAAAGYLGLEGLHLDSEIPVNTVKVFGAVAAGVVGALVACNEPLNWLAAMPEPKEGLLRIARKVFQPMFNKPLRSSAVLDCVSGVQLIIGAVIQPDPGMIGGMALWGVGASGLSMSDESTQRRYWAGKLCQAHIASKKTSALKLSTA